MSNAVPGSEKYFEDWLKDEIHLTYMNYERIIIFPQKYNSEKVSLPFNCDLINYQDVIIKRLNFFELINCFKIVFTDLLSFGSLFKFFSYFKYNFSLIKSLHLKAKKVSNSVDLISRETIIYAYWAGDLATTACIIKAYYHSCIVVTRGHGFEIFEEQTLNKFIPFRKFQYKFLDKLFADSQKGMTHLNLNNKFTEIKLIDQKDRHRGVVFKNVVFNIYAGR